MREVVIVRLWLLCGRPNRPHYRSCPTVRSSVRSVRYHNSKTKKT